jgi:hypothetical protein
MRAYHQLMAEVTAGCGEPEAGEDASLLGAEVVAMVGVRSEPLTEDAYQRCREAMLADIQQLGRSPS